MATPSAFTIRAFRNRSGSISYRVEGKLWERRIRKNFRHHADAIAYCDSKNAEAAKIEPMRLVQTRIADDDLRAVEASVQRIQGRWTIGAVLDAGIEALGSAPTAQPVAPLAEEWLILIKPQVSKRWLTDLKSRTLAFVRDNPGLKTTGMTRAVVRSWLDGLPGAPLTKSHARGIVHRFAGWLVERGFLVENPAARIRIAKTITRDKPAGASLPAVLSPAQCEALLAACLRPECRRILGWVVLCLFAGLRPEGEAPRLTWPEINFRTREISVLGRKRGAKPRIVGLQPAALAWLRIVKADDPASPGSYSRTARRQLIPIANEILAETHPSEPAIVWVQDILRHSYASYRAGTGVSITDLADEMGNSPRTIYAHYRHPRTAAQVKAFLAILPARLLAATRK
jgi:integrase